MVGTHIRDGFLASLSLNDEEIAAVLITDI
jgi:hypothetical protein